MNLYPLLRDALFQCEPECAHTLSLNVLQKTAPFPFVKRIAKTLGLASDETNVPTTLGGMTLRNPVGLAAGLDKNAEYLEGLFSLGFGFIEVGTATPKPQSGNATPRLFRLPEYRAIINRMGFNNDGVKIITARVRDFREQQNALGKPMGKIGINVGKNATTPLDQALDDYQFGITEAHAHADYLTINISSPNTKGLRDLQQAQHLRQLLEPLRENCNLQNQKNGKVVPLWLKVAPDLTSEDVALMAEVIRDSDIDGIIATNTTLSREGVQFHRLAEETGGLSGAPLTQKATDMVALWRSCLPDLPIIGVGGIMSAEHALAKKIAGANVVQLYSGLIYEGPSLIGDINRIWTSGS